HPISTLFPYTTLFRSYDPDPEEPAPSVVPALLGDLSGLVFRAGLDHHRPHLYHPQPPGRPDPIQRVVHLPVLQLVFPAGGGDGRSEEHTSELQSRFDL